MSHEQECGGSGGMRRGAEASGQHMGSRWAPSSVFISFLFNPLATFMGMTLHSALQILTVYVNCSVPSTFPVLRIGEKTERSYFFKTLISHAHRRVRRGLGCLHGLQPKRLLLGCCVLQRLHACTNRQSFSDLKRGFEWGGMHALLQGQRERDREPGMQCKHPYRDTATLAALSHQ